MKKKKIVLFVFLIVGVLSLILTYKLKQNNLSKNKPVKEEKLSIMIKEDGATEYTKSSSKDIPKGSYTLNTEKSYCKNNGKIEGYDNTTGTVSFAFIGTDRCFLYFDEIVPPLYNIIENRYKKGDTFVKSYNETESDDINPEKNIYFFAGSVENNNVLFADKCWKIVRTTDTGGVKMIYNGVPKYISDDYVLLNQSEYTNLINDASYPYTFDETNKTWTSTNTGIKSSTISFTVPSSGDYIINYDLSMYTYSLDNINVEIFKDNISQGKYTGVITGQIGFKDLTTTNVIKIVFTRKSSSTSGNRNNVIFSFGKTNSIIKTCNNTGTDAQIGTSIFNTSDGNSRHSLSEVGYMYNIEYKGTEKSILSYPVKASGQTWKYSDAVTYDSSTEKYTLDDSSMKTLTLSETTISSLIGKYTFESSIESGFSVKYIAGINGSYIYGYYLSKGMSITDVVKDYIFGSSFTYTNGVYELNDITTINTSSFFTSYEDIKKYHYTCFTNGTSCDSIYYVFYAGATELNYITLLDGKSVDDALNEMLYADNVNTYNSVVKTYVDTWYKNNMLSYTDKLEDTIFCNDRTIWGSKAGWEQNADFFQMFFGSTHGYSCKNETDKFSVNNSKARLTYPVGLLTYYELDYTERYGTGTSYLITGQDYWTMSPNNFQRGEWLNNSCASKSNTYSCGIGDSAGVRPVISLKYGTEISSGNGTYTNPFVVE